MTIPPRKGVMAFNLEPMEENGDEFFVLTFHHGLGEMTRLDLDDNDVRQLADLLRASQAPSGHDSCPECHHMRFSHRGPLGGCSAHSRTTPRCGCTLVDFIGDDGS